MYREFQLFNLGGIQMALIDNFNQYKYIGFPFEAFGWPGPVYNRLVGSNDGLNWTCLQKYDTSWRDCDLAKINGHYFIAGTDYNIYWTDDFETFNKIPMSGKYPMAWAPEWFRDVDGTWHILYATGDTSMSGHFVMMCRTFDPTTYVWGTPKQITFSNGNDGKIDPDIKFINGKYYLWIANQQNMEIELYQSDSLLGTYEPVNTNITQMVSAAGFSKNEAPEMMYQNGEYWLYCDPWKDGLGEHDRCMYRTTSKDMVNWQPLEKLNCSFGLRHFTPLEIAQSSDGSGDLFSDIKLWNGNVNELYQTNIDNYLTINRLIGIWNASDNPFIEPINFIMDATDYSENNRAAYNQLISNAQTLIEQLPKLVELYRIIDQDFICTPPQLPDDVAFNQTEINKFWNWVSQTLGWIINQIKQVS